MRIYEFFLTLVLGFVLVLAVMNKSVFSYIEQKYHTTPFDPSSPVLYALGTPARALDSVRAWLFPSKEELALSVQEPSLEPKIEPEQEQEPEIEQVTYPLITQEGRIILEPESTFLFIGDSLMQGVGMTLGRELKKRGFSVIDIAKQSTGLTYVDFFDWGKTLKDAFTKNPHIKVVVIMVGANDPYNMPKIKYASPEWVEVYSARIREILETANAHNAIVVWYEVPIVKKPSLNAKLVFLNTLYAREVASFKAVFLPTNAALAPEGVYTAYGKTQAGKSVKLRANDGIHFSGDGSRVLGGLLLERLEIISGEDSALGNHSRVGFLKKPASASPCTAVAGFGAKNGDCCGEPAVITTQGNSLDSPCKAPFLSPKSCREQTEPESTFENNAQNSQSPTSNTAKQATAVQGEAAAGFFRVPRILEEESPAQGKNQLESKNLDSSVQMDSMDCHDFACAKSRNDSSLDSSFSPSLRDDLSAKQSTTPSNHILLDSSTQVESMDSKDTSATTALESLLMSDND